MLNVETAMILAMAVTTNGRARCRNRSCFCRTLALVSPIVYHHLKYLIAVEAVDEHANDTEYKGRLEDVKAC